MAKAPPKKQDINIKIQTAFFNIYLFYHKPVTCGKIFSHPSPYDAFFSGKLEDYEYPIEKIKEALTAVPKI